MAVSLSDTTDPEGTGSGSRTIPPATVARLPLYFRVLVDQRQAKVATISSRRLAEFAGVNAAKVRKDLSYLGSYGTRGVGYDVAYLLSQISRELGLTHDWPCVIVGVGNLGEALAKHFAATGRGFPVAALVDADPAKQGRSIQGIEVVSDDHLPTVIRDRGITIGIITTPPTVAQEMADRLIDAGVTTLLNFAPVVLSVEPTVLVRNVDLALELRILSFHAERLASRPAPSS